LDDVPFRLGGEAGQEVVLAIHLKRSYFDSILANAYPSSNVFGLPDAEWEEKIENTNVRLQWDPDHDPYGKKVERRAIQLGLRNEFLLPFKGDGLIEIENISDFVAEQRSIIESGNLDKLVTPTERVYELSEQVKRSLTIAEI
jgi:hypothetical protein